MSRDSLDLLENTICKRKQLLYMQQTASHILSELCVRVWVEKISFCLCTDISRVSHESCVMWWTSVELYYIHNQGAKT